MISLATRYLLATILLCGSASAAINMSGTWQFTLPVSGGTGVTYTGPLTQVATCATTATVIGSISDAGSVTINVTLNGQTRTLSGNVSADGNTASGTYNTGSGSCLTVTSGTWMGTRLQQVLPQFAFGGGWYSALYFSNEANTAASFSLTFVASDGTPLNVPSIGGSTTTVNLSPNGAAIVEALNTGGLSQGTVFMALPGGVVGYGIFRQSVPNLPDQEAVVPLSSTSTTASRLTWDDTLATTAVAFVNSGSTTTTVSIAVHDSLGNVLGTASFSLDPHVQTAKVLRGLAGLAAVAGTRGSADFTATGGTGGTIAVLGLRFVGAAFTSIPTADR